MTTVHLIHGIRSREGGAPALLRPYFEAHGLPVSIVDYGYARGLLSRFQNSRRAKMISKGVRPEDVIVGHSNGGTLAWMIQKLVPVAGLVLIHPALDEDVRFRRAGWVDVYHCASDHVVEMSEWFGFFDLFPHPYGRLGAVGYIGKDQHVTSIDDGRLTVDLRKMNEALPPVRGHSEIFAPTHIEPWGRYIAGRVAWRLGRTVKTV